MEDAINTDDEMYKIYFSVMLENGIMVPPSKYESHFISLSHSDEDIEKIWKSIEKSFQKIKNKK